MNIVKPKTDYQRLVELAGTRYGQIYQAIKKVNVITSSLEVKKTYFNGEVLVLEVIHQTGKYSFPIEECSKTLNPAHSDEIQNIFFNLLSMSTTNKLTA